MYVCYYYLTKTYPFPEFSICPRFGVYPGVSSSFKASDLVDTSFSVISLPVKARAVWEYMTFLPLGSYGLLGDLIPSTSEAL